MKQSSPRGGRAAAAPKVEPSPSGGGPAWSPLPAWMVARLWAAHAAKNLSPADVRAWMSLATLCCRSVAFRASKAGKRCLGPQRASTAVPEPLRTPSRRRRSVLPQPPAIRRSAGTSTAAVAAGCGRGVDHARRSLGKLERAGLAVRQRGRGWSLPSAPADDALDAAGLSLLTALGNRPGRLLPVPRRLLRHAAGTLTRGELAAVVACLVRCCWLRRGGGAGAAGGSESSAGEWRADFDGRVCVAQAAEATGVCERTLRAGRDRLESAGLLGRCNRSPAWADARWGRRLVVAPAEPRGDSAVFTGPALSDRAGFAAPDLTKTPAKRDVKHQDAARRPSGPSRSRDDGSPTRRGVGVGVSSGEGEPRPDADRTARSVPGRLTIGRADLTDVAKLGALYDRLRNRGDVADGPAARVRFAGAAARAAEHGTNPGGLFRWLLRELAVGRRLDWITQAQEDRGLLLLKSAERAGDDEDGGEIDGPCDGGSSVPANPPTTHRHPPRPEIASSAPAPSATTAVWPSNPVAVIGARGWTGVPDVEVADPVPIPPGPYVRPARVRPDAELVEWARGWATIRGSDPAVVLRERHGWDDGRIALALATAAGQALASVAVVGGGAA